VATFSRTWHEYRDDELSWYIDDRDLPGDIRAFLAEGDVAALLTNWALVFGVAPPVLRGRPAPATTAVRGLCRLPDGLPRRAELFECVQVVARHHAGPILAGRHRSQPAGRAPPTVIVADSR
jgi:hypothetical protein